MMHRSGGIEWRRGMAHRRRAFNMMELLVIIAIIALLMAILLPSMRKAKVSARQLICAQNLRQWSIAWQMYRDEYNDYLATEGTYLKMDKPYTWFTVLPPYLDMPPYIEFERRGQYIVELPNVHTWICPEKNLQDTTVSDSGKNQFHYTMNRVLDGTGSEDGGYVTPGFPDMGEKPIPARMYQRRRNETVLMFDTVPNQPNSDPRAASRFHDGGANVLFLSGAVEWFGVKRFVTDGDWENGDIIWDDPKLFWGYTPIEGR